MTTCPVCRRPNPTPRREVCSKSCANRKYRWFRRYSLDPEDVWRMWNHQGARCALRGCRMPLEGPLRGRATHIDHSHGECCPGRRSCKRCVRGIVCRCCNATLDHYDRITRICANGHRLTESNAITLTRCILLGADLYVNEYRATRGFPPLVLPDSSHLSLDLSTVELDRYGWIGRLVAA